MFLQVVRVEDNEALYLLINGKSRLIPDKETLIFLGFDVDKVDTISSHVFDRFRREKPIDSMRQRNTSPDEVMRTYSTKFRTIQDNDKLIKDSVRILETFNPALVFWKGKYFSTSRGMFFFSAHTLPLLTNTIMTAHHDHTTLCNCRSTP